MNLPSLDYDSAKTLIQDPDPASRLRVASDPAAPAETLFYLAEDESLEVRLAVAQNPATPRLANLALAKDADYGVRCALARKFVDSGLDSRSRADLWRLGFTVLEILATDQVVRVRQFLAGGLKSFADAPRDIIMALARDPEPEVSVPVLEESPVLKDKDLITILDDAPQEWVQQAIVRRTPLGQKVSQKAFEIGSEAVIGALIKNENAQISDKTYDKMIERAPDHLGWHEPMVRRTAMPGKMLVKIAQFVAKPLLAMIVQRRDLDRSSEKALDKIAEERGLHPQEDRAPALSGAPSWAKGTAAERTARSWDRGSDMAIRLHQEGRLDDEVVSKALESGETEFVQVALAVRAHIGIDSVKSIISSRSAKAVTALCWKAEFRMRFAIDVQRQLSNIPHDRLLNARDGVDFPLSPEEMEQHLGYFVD